MNNSFTFVITLFLLSLSYLIHSMKSTCFPTASFLISLYFVLLLNLLQQTHGRDIFCSWKYPRSEDRVIEGEGQ